MVLIKNRESMDKSSNNKYDIKNTYHRIDCFMENENQ